MSRKSLFTKAVVHRFISGVREGGVPISRVMFHDYGDGHKSMEIFSVNSNSELDDELQFETSTWENAINAQDD